MQNRITQFFEEPAQPERRTEWFEVYVQGVTYYVDRSTAAEVEERLELEPLPRWLVFRDVYGSRQRVPASGVMRVSESTAEQRQSARDFYRARQQEFKADRRPWEDDD